MGIAAPPITQGVSYLELFVKQPPSITDTLLPFGVVDDRPVGQPGSVLLSFYVHGTPKPKARPRTVRNKHTGFTHTYTPATTVNWEQTVVYWAKQALAAIAIDHPDAQSRMPYEARICATVTFYVTRPKSAPKSVQFPMKAQPGDVDNLAKSVLDALQLAGVIADDKTVTDLTTSKRFIDDEHPEGCEVQLAVHF